MFVQKRKICDLYEGSEIMTKQHKFSPKTLGILARCHILINYYCADRVDQFWFWRHQNPNWNGWDNSIRKITNNRYTVQALSKLADWDMIAILNRKWNSGTQCLMYKLVRCMLKTGQLPFTLCGGSFCLSQQLKWKYSLISEKVM